MYAFRSVRGMTAALVILTGSVLLGGASTPASAAVTVYDQVSSIPNQVAPVPPKPEGTFIPTPVYGNLGLAMVVYTGGTVSDLQLAAGYAGAIGVWVQDVGGRFQLLPVTAPIFVQESFAGAFPPASPGAPNFARVTAVTLVR